MAGVPLTEQATRLARAGWFERRCFELVGAWVVDTPEPPARLLFARQSHHHAWRADVLARLVPVASGFAFPPPPPPSGWVAVLDALGSAPTAAARAGGLFGSVLPAAISAYEDWLADANPVTDAPLVRWLGLVLHDTRADQADGETLLARLGAGEPGLGGLVEAAGALL